jgi:hypothetical protein
MKEYKGGVFAPADFELIKRALSAYRNELLDVEGEEEVDAELAKVASLLHRINNRT